MGRADTARSTKQDISERGEPKPELMGPHAFGRGAVGEEVELLLFNPVFHLAAGAIEVLVKGAPTDLAGLERGDDGTGVQTLGQPFRLGHDPAPARPALQRAMIEIPEGTLGFSAFRAARFELRQFVYNLCLKALVAGQAEDVVDAVLLAPRHQLFAGETGIPAQEDFDVRPTVADMFNEALNLFPSAG